MKKLYVNGNGFDLNFGLSTKTRDFVKELEKIKFDCFSSARDIYSSYGVDWSSFEEDLANLDIEEIDEEVTEAPDYMAAFDSARDGRPFFGLKYTRIYCTISYTKKTTKQQAGIS